MSVWLHGIDNAMDDCSDLPRPRLALPWTRRGGIRFVSGKSGEEEEAERRELIAGSFVIRREWIR